MDRFPPAEDGPRYELQSVGRTLDDLDLDPETEAAPAAQRRFGGPLIAVGVTILALMAFVGWLLLGPPLTH